MYKGISTGKNKNYGKKGEKIKFPNTSLRYVIRDKIATNIKADGTEKLVVREAHTNKFLPYKRFGLK
jgi:hypothetical protein